MKSLNDNFRTSIKIFYDKTHSEEPLMLGLDYETELTAANL